MKQNSILLLTLAFSFSQLAISEENADTDTKKQEAESTDYVPYTPAYNQDTHATYNAAYNYYFGGGFGGVPQTIIHKEVSDIAKYAFADQTGGDGSAAWDLNTSNALWAYYAAESATDYPREAFKNNSELFIAKDGKTNIANRLREINKEFNHAVFELRTDDSPDYDLRAKKIQSLSEEFKKLYAELKEKINKAENKEVAAKFVADTMVVPEVKVSLQKQYEETHGSPLGHAVHGQGAYGGVPYGAYGGMGSMYPYGGMGYNGYVPYDAAAARKLSEEYQRAMDQYRAQLLLQQQLQEQKAALERSAQLDVILKYYEDKEKK